MKLNNSYSFKSVIVLSVLSGSLLLSGCNANSLQAVLRFLARNADGVGKQVGKGGDNMIDKDFVIVQVSKHLDDLQYGQYLDKQLVSIVDKDEMKQFITKATLHVFNLEQSSQPYQLSPNINVPTTSDAVHKALGQEINNISQSIQRDTLSFLIQENYEEIISPPYKVGLFTILGERVDKGKIENIVERISQEQLDSRVIVIRKVVIAGGVTYIIVESSQSDSQENNSNSQPIEKYYINASMPKTSNNLKKMIVNDVIALVQKDIKNRREHPNHAPIQK